MAFDKVRIRFRKDGDLRLVSHHDLMRAFERMLRRANLPFRSTEGFHPQPRVVFAQSLPLGVAGLAEVVEIEWTEPVEPEEALERLRAQAPPGLSFLSAVRIELKQSARPRRAVYRLPVSVADVNSLAARCAEVLAAPELWVDRERPRPRQVNVRPYLRDLRIEGSSLAIDVWITPDGSARADEVARALGLSDWLDAGAVIERTHLELTDEVGPDAEAPPALTREQRAALERPLPAEFVRPEPETTHAAHWGASPAGPLVE